MAYKFLDEKKKRRSYFKNMINIYNNRFIAALLDLVFWEFGLISVMWSISLNLKFNSDDYTISIYSPSLLCLGAIFLIMALIAFIRYFIIFKQNIGVYKDNKPNKRIHWTVYRLWLLLRRQPAKSQATHVQWSLSLGRQKSTDDYFILW